MSKMGYYIKHMESQLSEWKAKIERLQSEASNPDMQAKIEHYQALIEYNQLILLSVKAELAVQRARGQQ